MNQFPSKQRGSVLDSIPTPVLVVGWLIALCLSAVCLYWAIFGIRAPSQTAITPTQVAAQQVNPTMVVINPQETAVVNPQASATPVPVQPGETPDPTKPQPTPTLSPLVDPAFGNGVQINGLVGSGSDACERAGNVRANWVKQQVRWGVFGHGPNESDVDWSGFDWVVRACNKRGIKVMLSIVTAPEWSRPGMGDIHGPPSDLNAYANFVGMVVDRYKGQVHAIEVWNEQNLSREWTTNPQQLSAARYVELLKLTYNTVKAKDPNIIVISGALSPTGVDDGINAMDDFRYLQQMVDAGLLNYADCVGAHHNGYNVGPSVSAATAMQHPEAATALFKGPFTSFNGGLPHHSWFFYDTLQNYAKIVGGRKPLCVTEFGWASSEGYPDAPQGFEFAKDNTLQEQSDYILEAYTLMEQWGFVKLAFLWNLDYGNKGTGYLDDVVPYSLVDTQGLPRPAYTTLRKFFKRYSVGD